MPATDALQPPLSQDAKAVVKSYGSWTGFSHAHGYKPWDSQDAADAARLAETIGREDKAATKGKK